MANTFWRNPIAGGDNNVWANYLLSIIKTSVGEYTSYLYNDSGTLKVSPGRIGIDNGTVQGVSLIDTATTITIAGTNGRWYKIEMAVSGTGVAFSSVVLTGTNPAILPAELTGSYITKRRGFYDDSSRRLIGVVWKNSSGVLDGIINCENMVKGYHGYVFLDSNRYSKMYYTVKIDSYRRWVEYDFGITWNMDTTQDYGPVGGVTPMYLSTELSKVLKINVIITNNAATFSYDINAFTNAADPSLLNGGINSWSYSTDRIQISRRAGGIFDDASFNAATVKMYIEMSL